MKKFLHGLWVYEIAKQYNTSFYPWDNLIYCVKLRFLREPIWSGGHMSHESSFKSLEHRTAQRERKECGKKTVGVPNWYKKEEGKWRWVGHFTRQQKRGGGEKEKEGVCLPSLSHFCFYYKEKVLFCGFLSCLCRNAAHFHLYWPIFNVPDANIINNHTLYTKRNETRIKHPVFPLFSRWMRA